LKASKVLLVVLVIGVGSACLVGGCVASGYNKTIGLDEQVNSAWAQVDSKLQRRFDLIPNLVETVKGIAGHEHEVFTKLAKSREAYFQAKGPRDKARAASGFESALSRLLVMRESYPELKSNQNFLKLQDSIEGSENRISVERDRYNAAVRDLNTYIRQLGGRLYASLSGVEEAEYFEAAEEAKSVPKVDFSTPAGGDD
jgi:LemA protein